MTVAIETVINAVSQFYGVPVSEILGSGRGKSISYARHAFYYLACRYTGMGLVQIGRFVNRNHSTIIMGNRKFKGLLDVYPSTKREVATIEQQFLDFGLIVSHVDLLAVSNRNSSRLSLC